MEEITTVKEIVDAIVHEVKVKLEMDGITFPVEQVTLSLERYTDMQQEIDKYSREGTRHEQNFALLCMGLSKMGYHVDVSPSPNGGRDIVEIMTTIPLPPPLPPQNSIMHAQFHRSVGLLKDLTEGMKRLDESGVIDKKIFRGLPHLVKEAEEFIKKINA